MPSLRGGRGQALVEVAIVLPVLMFMTFMLVDLAHGFYLAVEISGATRAGVRDGIVSDTSDLGDAIRSEPNSAIADTTAVWGDTGPGGVDASCTAAPGSQSCGDPNGCPSSVFTGGRLACFAVRSCTLSSSADSGSCTSYGAWGSRPASTSSATRGLQVKVVYKLIPFTPFVATRLAGGLLYLTSTTTGDELYF
ncbi:MAG: TadE/TadG family type IV pilus assembly protein [Candidatus Dormibacterales bacterium]